MLEYVGEVGKRLHHLVVEVTDAPWSMETKYGPTILYQVKDEDDNVLVWFTDKKIELKVGEVRRMRGTVKRHSEFRGKKQTLLTRVKVGGQGVFQRDIGNSFDDLCKEEGIPDA